MKQPPSLEDLALRHSISELIENLNPYRFECFHRLIIVGDFEGAFDILYPDHHLNPGDHLNLLPRKLKEKAMILIRGLYFSNALEKPVFEAMQSVKTRGKSEQSQRLSYYCRLGSPSFLVARLALFFSGTPADTICKSRLLFLVACQIGNLTLLKAVPDKTYNDTPLRREGFQIAYKKGHLGIAQLLSPDTLQNIEFLNDPAFQKACESGDLEKAKEIYQNNVPSEDINDEQKKQLEAARQQLLRFAYLLFPTILRKKHIDIAQWLYHLFPNELKKILQEYLLSHSLQFVLKPPNIPYPQIIDELLKSFDNWDLMKIVPWFYQRASLEEQNNICDQITRFLSGVSIYEWNDRHVDLLNFLAEHSQTPSQTFSLLIKDHYTAVDSRLNLIFRLICMKRRLQTAQWFYSQCTRTQQNELLTTHPSHVSKVPYFNNLSENPFSFAFRHNHVHVAHFLHKRATPLQQENMRKVAQFFLPQACEIGYFESVEWLHAVYQLQWSEIFDVRYFILACQSNHHLAQFFYTQGTVEQQKAMLNQMIQRPKMYLFFGDHCPSDLLLKICRAGHSKTIAWFLELVPNEMSAALQAQNCEAVRCYAYSNAWWSRLELVTQITEIVPPELIPDMLDIFATSFYQRSDLSADDDLPGTLREVERFLVLRGYVAGCSPPRP